jgi:hypothetical protein
VASVIEFTCRACRWGCGELKARVIDGWRASKKSGHATTVALTVFAGADNSYAALARAVLADQAAFAF